MLDFPSLPGITSIADTAGKKQLDWRSLFSSSNKLEQNMSDRISAKYP